MAGILGWAIVATAAACLIRSRLARRNADPEDAKGAVGDPAGISREEGEAWCGAIEALSDSTVFLFDEAMSLVAMGPAASRGGELPEVGAHVIDIAPADGAAEFIDAAAAARRGQRRSWETLWRGRRCAAVAVPVSSGSFLVWIRG